MEVVGSHQAAFNSLVCQFSRIKINRRNWYCKMIAATNSPGNILAVEAVVKVVKRLMQSLKRRPISKAASYRDILAGYRTKTNTSSPIFGRRTMEEAIRHRQWIENPQHRSQSVSSHPNPYARDKIRKLSYLWRQVGHVEELKMSNTSSGWKLMFFFLRTSL